MIRSKHLAQMAATLAVLLGSWACQSEPGADRDAHATLITADGREVAHAQFAETEAGVKMQLTVDGLPPGTYQAQIHEVGECRAPGFLSAGAPYPPPEELAMVESVAQPLHRSIAQFEVSDGRVDVEAVAPIVTLRSGHNSLFHPGGTALIIDDLSPTGTYKGRVACGAITRASEHPVDGLRPGALESAQHPGQVGTPGKEYRQPESKP